MMKTISINSLFITSLLLVTLYPVAFTEPYDPSATVYRFQKEMAERGNIESQFKLGLMYETGSGVEQGLVNAIIWYRKAADQNYNPASNRLIYLEVKKNGFKQHHNTWLKNLKKDADFNEGEALFLLGQMYAEGTGVTKSLTRALSLLRKAAGGNIPGSEAEIQRVEQELAALQEKYLNEEEKQKVTPVVVTKKQNKTKTPKLKVTPTITLPPAPVTAIPEKTTVVKKVIKPKPTHTESKISTTKTASPPIKKVIPIAIETPEPIVIPPTKATEEHPMDTICGGRYRFSPGCR